KELGASEGLNYLSVDRNVEALGHVERTTGAGDMSRQPGNDGIDGSGIGIAVLDSGLYADHFSFRDSNQKSRIAVSLDFTGDAVTANDPYGHGTHVAGLAVGNSHGTGISERYEGIAPNADIISLRVLDEFGRGSISNVL